MSNLRTISEARCNWRRASLNSDLLQIFRSLATRVILVLSLAKAQRSVVGRFHALSTVSWKCGCRGQKDSNLNLAHRRGAAAAAGSNGQWSEQEVDAACSRCVGKRLSHAIVQKNLSMLTRVGFLRSLLQVKQRFLHLISRRPLASMAALNLPMILRLMLLLLLSLASYIMLKSPLINQASPGWGATLAISARKSSLRISSAGP